jgi:hypothetical protein
MDSKIDDAIMEKELSKIDACQWCLVPSSDKVLIDLDDDDRYFVCQKCAIDFVNGNFDSIKRKIKELKA